jgi:hypothetical protein
MSGRIRAGDAVLLLDDEWAECAMRYVHGKENLLDEIGFAHAAVDMSLHHVLGSW